MLNYGSPSRALMLVVTLMAFAFSQIRADTITNPLSMCSSENTGVNPTFLQYNSVGSCSEHCAGYSFAILQGTSCYCSNVKPGTSVSVSNCSDSCPGYGSDRCGNILEQLYGYVQLAAASSTASSASSSTSTSASSVSSSSTSMSSSSDSASASSTGSSSTGTSGSSSAGTSTSISGSSSMPSSSITSTATSNSAASTASSSSSASASSSSNGSTELINKKADKGFWGNTGAVAGVFTAVGIVGAALVALLVFFFWRRRRDNNDDHEKVFDDNNSNTTRVPSSQNGEIIVNHQKGGHPDSFMEDGDSHLVPIFDQRVDPTQMYMRWEGATSQQSLQDNQDYSRRVLQVANPDE